jgi:hypothetical protein
MRPHGKANISAIYPRALAVCDRCGGLYNHTDLSWQHQWRGVKLQNVRILVCPSCLDVPQEQLRVIILPMDPVPIMNARPENYVDADNPMSALGYSPISQTIGGRFGNLLGGGGLNAAFDGNPTKPWWRSAANAVSNSSYNNYVGINWSGANAALLSAPSSLLPPVLRHSLTSFTLTAPSDRSFLGNNQTDYLIQASPSMSPVFETWTTISSGTTAGLTGEVITGNCVAGYSQFHRAAFLGDGLSPVTVAQVSFNVAQVGEIATGGSS